MQYIRTEELRLVPKSQFRDIPNILCIHHYKRDEENVFLKEVLIASFYRNDALFLSYSVNMLKTQSQTTRRKRKIINPRVFSVKNG